MNAATCRSITEYLSLDLSRESVRIQNYCPVAILRGSWYDMGRQYAAQAHRPIRYYIGSQLGDGLSHWGSYAAIYRALPRYEAMLAEAFPQYLDFVRGIQAGLNENGFAIAYEDVLTGFVSLGRPDPDTACAAASAWGSATGGGVFAGIHSDSPQAANYAHPAVIAFPEGAHAFVSFTGFTNGYMNDAGLACMSTAGSAGAAGDIAPGLPICIGLLYNAAFSATAEAAVTAHVEKCRIGSGEICNYTDRGGRGFVLETTAGHYAVRTAGDFGETDFLAQSNSYLTAEMQSSGGTVPGNVYRYDSIFKYLSDNVGHISLDTLRAALANTSYYDKAADKWVYEWDLVTGSWSPERKATLRGPAMRRMFDLTAGDAYIVTGAEDTLVSKIPHALGAYARIRLLESPEAIAAASIIDAREQLWYAARDLDGQRRAGIDIRGSMADYDEARESLYLGINAQTIAAAAVGNERLALLAQSVSQFNRAQSYARAAQSDGRRL